MPLPAQLNQALIKGSAGGGASGLVRSRLLGGGPPPLCQYGRVPKVLRLAGFAVLFAAGALLAVAIGRAQDVTTTETTTTVSTATTTASASTVTTTLEQTATRRVVVPPPTTTSSSDEDQSVPTWAWVLIGALALGLLILLAVLLSRRGGSGLSPAERRGRLDAAVDSWLAQGWAIESQGPDSAVMRRDNELMLVGVDASGYVSTRPVYPE